MTNLICGAKDVLVISLGAYMTVDGQMTAGEYVSFIAYSGMMNWPLRQLGRTISELSKAGVSLDRLMYIMNSESEEDEDAALDYPGAGDIEFKNVSGLSVSSPIYADGYKVGVVSDILFDYEQKNATKVVVELNRDLSVICWEMYK